MNKPYCPDCGEPMRDSDESDAHIHAGAFICVACGYDCDCPPEYPEVAPFNLLWCPDCGYEVESLDYCEHCDMTRQAHETLYPDEDNTNG